MNPSHSAFFDRPEGVVLKKLLTRPEIIPQYELLSQIEIPAIQAAVWDIEPVIENLDKATRNYAVQSSGALIGELLSQRGFRIVRTKNGENRRGSIRRSRFIKSGTIWEKAPVISGDHHEKVMAIMDSIMERYHTTLTELAK